MTKLIQDRYVDRAHAHVLLAAGLKLSKAQTEQAKAEGVYGAVCYEPIPQHREAYMRTRDELAALQALTLTARVNHLDRIQYLREKINDFEHQEVWSDLFPNVVCTVGKNLMLDSALAGSAYTVAGPYMGLISSASFTGVAASDTMSSHGGWLEAGGANAPTYTAPRKTCAWSAASAGGKSLSASLSYSMTSGGTVKGCFILFGAGALNTVDNAGGTLYSAGTFTGGDQPVVAGNTLAVSYSTSL